MRKVVSAVIIEHNKLLLVKKRDTYILPGGKPEEGERDVDCLGREIGEELSGTQIKVGEFYDYFRGKAPHKGDIIENLVYFAEIGGRLGDASREVSDAIWVDSSRRLRLISEITRKVFIQLIKDKYLRKV